MRLSMLLLILAAPVLAAHEAGSLHIAAAADLTFCLGRLNAEFAKMHPGLNLKVSTGSSGNFFAQIKNGAPYDVFLSADAEYPGELIKAGLAAKNSLTRYAVGRIVLWTARPDIEMSSGLEILRSDSIKHVAIANPGHAPYGRAARAALQKAGLWEAVQSKLVLGENIAQAAQFVQSGNADAGIVALSIVMSPRLKGVGHYVEIPEELHPRLEQAAVLTNKGADNPLARAYLDFLQTPAARTVFDEFGFKLPK